MLLRKLAFVVVISMMSAGWAFAARANDSTYVTRDWRSQNTEMTASLSLSVPVQGYDANGNPVTHYETKWVYVTVRVGPDASLRKGEVEYFRVSAYASGGSFPTINIHVDPVLVYHSYSSGFAGTSVSSNVYVYLPHNGRIRNVPPPTFSNAKLDFSDIDAPVVLSFEDFAFDDNSEATATYAFTIKRNVFLFPDKLVAKGEIARPAEGDPAVVISKDSVYTEGAKEWFKKGKTYIVELKLKREGSQYYVDKWSNSARFKVKWDEDGKGLVRIDDPDFRTKAVSARFRALHRD